jgi:hypothetical protein
MQCILVRDWASEIRARIYLRKHNCPLTPENIEAREEEELRLWVAGLRGLRHKTGSAIAALRVETSGITRDDIENAFLRGQEVTRTPCRLPCFHDLVAQVFGFVPIQCVGYNRELRDDLVAAVDTWIAEGSPGAFGKRKKETTIKRETRSPPTSRLRSPSRVKSEPEESDEDILFSDDDNEPLDAQEDWEFVPPPVTKSGRAVRQPGRY